MAGQPRKSLGKAKSREQQLAEREKRRQDHAEVRELFFEWRREGIVQHGTNPVEALQALIDRAFENWQMEVLRNQRKAEAGEEVDLTQERSLAKESAYYDDIAMRYDLSKQWLKLNILTEARRAYVAEVMKRSLIDLGIPEEQMKQLPALIAEHAQRLETSIDGNGYEVTPKTIMPPPDH
jgi:hypothetical protein